VTGADKLDYDMVNAYRRRLVPLGKACIPELDYTIHAHGNWMVRHLAVSALRELKDPEAIPALIDALNDRTSAGRSFAGGADDRTNQYYIRQNAALALKEIGKEAVFALKKIAADRRHPDFENAVYALSKADGIIVEDLLQKIARDSSLSDEVRMDALWGIAGKSDESNRICCGMLREPKLRDEAARALKQSRDKDAIPHLMAVVREAEKDCEAASAAAEVVSDIAGNKWRPDTTEEWVDYCLLGGQETRRSIDRKIGKAALPRLTWWARSEAKQMRLAAVEAFNGYPEPEVAELLLELIDDPSKDVRYEAVAALKVRRDYRVMAPLIRKLDSDPINQLRFVRLLRTWTQEDFGSDSKAWMEWWAKAKHTFCK
jgi:HEAT repeat protein